MYFHGESQIKPNLQRHWSTAAHELELLPGRNNHDPIIHPSVMNSVADGWTAGVQLWVADKEKAWVPGEVVRSVRRISIYTRIVTNLFLGERICWWRL